MLPCWFDCPIFVSWEENCQKNISCSQFHSKETADSSPVTQPWPSTLSSTILALNLPLHFAQSTPLTLFIVSSTFYNTWRTLMYGQLHQVTGLIQMVCLHKKISSSSSLYNILMICTFSSPVTRTWSAARTHLTYTPPNTVYLTWCYCHSFFSFCFKRTLQL